MLEAQHKAPKVIVLFVLGANALVALAKGIAALRRVARKVATPTTTSADPATKLAVAEKES